MPLRKIRSGLARNRHMFDSSWDCEKKNITARLIAAEY
jgi:hypothetical protein